MPRLRPLLYVGLPLLGAGLWLAAHRARAQAPSPPPPSPWSALAKGKIDLEGGLIQLAASREGLITQVLVEEGQDVVKDQVLATLDDRPARLALALAEKEAALAGTQLGPARLKHEAARREAARLDPLVERGGASAQERDQARDLVRQLEADLAVLDAALAGALARVDQAQYEVAQRVVRAPLDGRILRRMARPGNGVSTMTITPLFQFAPRQARIVRAELDEALVEAVRPGQRVDIVPERDDSRPISGRVLRLGGIVGARQPSEDPTERMDTRVVECVVSLDRDDLLLGQRVLVRFHRQGGPR